MKKLFCFLSMFFITVLVGLTVFSQSDTVLNFPNVSSQVGNVIQAATGQTLTWKIMLFSAIAGVLVRIVYTTYWGVKNTFNGTPVQFMFSYWVKDNILPKITTLLAFILSTNLSVKLPEGVWSYIIFGVSAFLAGLFIDWLTEFLKVLSPKVK
jgi:hypothetical protein